MQKSRIAGGSTVALFREVRILAATLALTALAFAEPTFTGLATNRDGSVLYFSSPLRLKGSEQFPWPKIFQWNRQEGVRLYQQRDAGKIVTGFGWGSIFPYRLIAPSLAENGAVAFTGVRDCTWGTPCATTVEKYQSTIRIPGKPDQFLDGSATLSANGRYALLISSRRFGGEIPLAPPIWWVDLETGEKVLVSALSRRIANDGTIVRARIQDGQQRLELWRRGSVKSIPRSFGNFLINASATVLAAQAENGLVAYDIASGQETILSRDPLDSPVDVSEDGGVIAFLNSGRLYTVRGNGSDLRQHAILDKIVSASLSGDGRVLFATSETSRILRIELDTGAVDEIVAPTTFYFLYDIAFSPTVGQGSLLQLTPIPSTHFPDIKPEFARFRGRTWPVLSADTNGITLQVPWDMPVEETGDFLELVLPSTTATPFQPAIVRSAPLRVERQALQWFANSSVVPQLFSSVLAAHEDFSALVTTDRPARAGEIIHAYGSGFGPVTTPPRTSEPASASPLSVLVDTIQCELGMGAETVPLQVLFGGLAPGMIGVYQIDLRMPEQLTGTSAILRCSSDASVTGGYLPLEFPMVH